MKKLLLILLLVSTFSFGQTTIFSENFGTGEGTIVSYYNGVQPNTFQNSFPIVYGGSGLIKNSAGGLGSEGNTWLPSNIANSSGSSFMLLYVGTVFTIEGLNTNNNQTNTLSFKIRLGVTTQSRADLKLEQSIDGVNYSIIPLPTLPPNQWVNLTISENLLNTANLRLRFTKINTSGTQGNISIDDINVTTQSLSNNTFDKSLVKIYPNPTKDYVKINLPEQRGLIKLHNIVGQLIYSQEINQPEMIIPIKNYCASGVNLLSLYDENGKLLLTEKIILQ